MHVFSLYKCTCIHLLCTSRTLHIACVLLLNTVHSTLKGQSDEQTLPVYEQLPFPNVSIVSFAL